MTMSANSLTSIGHSKSVLAFAENRTWVQPSTIAGVGLGLYLNTFILSSLFVLPRMLSYLAGSAIGGATIVLVLVSQDWRLNRNELLRWQAVAGLFAGILGCGYLLNAHSYDASLTLKVIGYGSLFATCSGVALIGGHRCVSTCFSTYLVGTLFAAVVVLAFNNVNPANGRLMGPFRSVGIQAEGLHPNDAAQLGMIAVILATSLGWRGVLSTFPLAIYLSIRCSSRGAMIGTVIAVALYFLLREFAARSAGRELFVLPKRGVWGILLVTVCIAVLTAFVGPYILDELLLRNDHQRGVSSGFTGRLDIWQGLFDAFMSSPLLGLGYGVVKAEAESSLSTADGGFLLLLA